MMQAFKYKEIDSSQDEARRLIHEGMDKFYILADSQTKGRGTQGRKWISELDSGLYFSLAFCLEKNLFSDADLTDFSRKITEQAVVVLKQSLIEFCNSFCLNDLYIKPINDLYYESKKLAGVLVEHLVFNDKSFLIVGIGLNILTPEHDVSFTPIGLQEILGLEFRFDKEIFAEKLAVALVDKLMMIRA